MFSTNQLIFAICFFVVFVIVMIIMYRKDLALHKREYKGAKWILLGFIVFIALLFVIKYGMKSTS